MVGSSPDLQVLLNILICPLAAISAANACDLAAKRAGRVPRIRSDSADPGRVKCQSIGARVRFVQAE